jgi:hypothetical protein
MAFIDRIFNRKSRIKRTKEEIEYEKVLELNQNKILLSYKCRAIASEQEAKILKKTLYNLVELESEFNVELNNNNNNTSIPKDGEYSFSNLAIDTLSGMDNEKIPGGRSGKQAIQSFLSQYATEINNVAGNQINKLTAIKENKDKEIIA